MEIFLEARDSLYYQGAKAVQVLQQEYPGIGPGLLSVSSWGDPSQGFLLYFPVILSLSYPRGLRFLGAFIVCEWLNMMAKWLLHGERPYWWVIENSQLGIQLQQTRLTCETGPGAPSGHSQAAAVIWSCLVDTGTGLAQGYRLQGWVVFLTMQLMMLFSRCYIGAHFPHQCLMGCGVGLLVVRGVYTSHSWINLTRAQLVLVSLFLITSSLGLFSLLLYKGFDPNWSIQLAKKHCERPEWIYVDTTPFYAMVRFSGSALGLSLCLPCPHPLSSPSLPRTASALAVSLGLAQLAAALHKVTPRSDLSQFYLLEFLLNAFTVLATVRSVQTLLRAPAGHAPLRDRGDGVKQP